MFLSVAALNELYWFRPGPADRSGRGRRLDGVGSLRRPGDTAGPGGDGVGNLPGNDLAGKPLQTAGALYARRS